MYGTLLFPILLGTEIGIEFLCVCGPLKTVRCFLLFFFMLFTAEDQARGISLLPIIKGFFAPALAVLEPGTYRKQGRRTII